MGLARQTCSLAIGLGASCCLGLRLFQWAGKPLGKLSVSGWITFHSELSVACPTSLLGLLCLWIYVSSLKVGPLAAAWRSRFLVRVGKILEEELLAAQGFSTEIHSIHYGFRFPALAGCQSWRDEVSRLLRPAPGPALFPGPVGAWSVGLGLSMKRLHDCLPSRDFSMLLGYCILL